MSKTTISGGVYPTMITPYTDDNKIDYNGVEQILQWYADRHVDGIFAICQSSEIFFLSFEGFSKTSSGSLVSSFSTTSVSVSFNSSFSSSRYLLFSTVSPLLHYIFNVLRNIFK